MPAYAARGCHVVIDRFTSFLSDWEFSGANQYIDLKSNHSLEVSKAEIDLFLSCLSEATNQRQTKKKNRCSWLISPFSGFVMAVDTAVEAGFHEVNHADQDRWLLTLGCPTHALEPCSIWVIEIYNISPFWFRDDHLKLLKYVKNEDKAKCLSLVEVL